MIIVILRWLSLCSFAALILFLRACHRDDGQQLFLLRLLHVLITCYDCLWSGNKADQKSCSVHLPTNKINRMIHQVSLNCLFAFFCFESFFFLSFVCPFWRFSTILYHLINRLTVRDSNTYKSVPDLHIIWQDHAIMGR